METSQETQTTQTEGAPAQGEAAAEPAVNSEAKAPEGEQKKEPEKQPEPEKKDPFHRGASALARKEREFRREKAEFEASKKAMSDELASYRAVKEALQKQDAAKVFEGLGITPEQWVDLLAVSQKERTPDVIAREIVAAELEKERKAREESQKKSAEEEYAQVRSRFASSMMNELKRSSQDLPMISRLFSDDDDRKDLVDYAVELSEEEFSKTGNISPYKEILARIDRDLSEKLGGPKNEKQAGESGKQPAREPTPTLSNRSTSGVPVSVPDEDKPGMSHEDRVARAMARSGFGKG